MKLIRFLHGTAMLLAAMVFASSMIGCAEIVEEEETETVLVTKETVPDASEMTADIDANLTLLASAYDAITSANPEGVNEHDFISANPHAFDAIAAWGEDAVPYLCEIGEGYQMAFSNMRIAPEEYAKCILAYAAAQEIDASTFDRSHDAPDGQHSLYLQTEYLWGIADPSWGIVYDAVLCDDSGKELVRTEGTSSYAVIDWTEDGRYAILSDPLREERQISQTTVFDTENGLAKGLPGRETFNVAAELSGMLGYTFETRYLDTVSADVLRIGFCLTSTDGVSIGGQYEYDLVLNKMMAVEYEPLDGVEDGRALARFLDITEVGSTVVYQPVGSSVYRLAVVMEQEWERTLYINGMPALDGFLFLNDIRAVGEDCIAVVTGGTDINSEHLYIFDANGNTLFDTYYLTDKGMVFRGIRAVEEDRILLDGGRGYHGPTLVAPTKEEITAGDYADWLYNDPISDTVSGGELEQDEFGEVPLYRDRMADDLNFDLVMEGVYALPYLGNGKFGKIEHVETVQTLGDFLDALYGE